ncbi:hypothetical protein [Gemmatimonas sp.]|jgi:hypothetical protein|uniref:hypothetical protein n=1 Tax=Gemmatimonas sp. TaxID=1962908 RepID=UPI0037C16221
MPVLHNGNGNAIPVRERREISGDIGALNAEVVLPLNGDETALVFVNSTAFIGTLEFTGLGDEVAGYLNVVAYPYSPGCVGGTIPPAGQPLLIDALVAANTQRVYSVPVGQLRALRVRASVFSSGSAGITITSDPNDPLNTAIAARGGTLFVTATGAAAAAVTATLPAVAGLRHVIDFIRVTRSASVALTAGAAPTVVTTTNLPGNPALTFGADAALQGDDKEVVLDFGGSGLAATALGTNTTVVCPVAAGVIWRVNVAYRLGL